MSNDWGFGEQIKNMFELMFILLLISIFGVWKIVEIIIWFIRHIKIV